MARFPKSQFIAAYQNAPDLVREVFNGEETATIIRDIRLRYDLHVDTSGTLGENVGYMLIGLLSPTEFFGEMVSAGVDQQAARGILEALNTRIFIPLQNKIKGGAQFVTPQREVLPPPSLAPAQPAIPAPIQEAVPTFNLIRPAESPATPVIRTMASDMRLTPPTDNPTLVPATPLTHTVQESQATPARSFQTASIPIAMTEPVIRPAESVPATQPALTQAPVTIQPVAAPAATQQPAPIYGSDPYREPI